MKSFVLCFALLIAGQVHAQSISLDAGANQLTDAQGVNMHFWFPDSQDNLSVGFVYDHFVIGADHEQPLLGGILDVGDKGFSVPGAYVPTRGVSWTKKTKNKRYEYTFFTGGVGEVQSQPFLSTMTASHFGVGADVTAKYGSLNTSTLALLDGNKKTFLESLSYAKKKFSFQTQTGLLTNQGTLSGSATFEPLTWTQFSASQSMVLYQGTMSETDSVGASVFSNSVGAHVALFRGHDGLQHTEGESAGVNFRASIFTVTTNYFVSTQMGQSPTEQEDVNISEAISRRLSLTQYINRNQNGTWSENFGGAISTNRIKVGLSYQTIFLPVTVHGSAFDQVAVVSVGLQFPRATGNYMTYVAPTGKSFMTGDVGTFLSGPFKSGNNPQHAGSSAGKYAIEGACLDDKNVAVEGCEVMAGNNVGFSGADGTFRIQVKSKTKTYPIQVHPTEFAAPGKWDVLSTIATAQVGRPIMIVVRRAP